MSALTTTRKGRRHNALKVTVVTVLITALAMFFAGMARAVHDVGLFELDGNVADAGPATGEDWNTYFPSGSGSASAKVFVSDQQDTSTPPDTTYFTGGGSKDINDVSSWLWTPGDQAPDKDEILNAYAVSYSAACSLGTCQYIYFGADRFAQNGDAQIGFWIFHNPIGLTGPATGGSFTGVHAVGDLLILSDFTNGGSVSTIKVYEWVGFGGTGSDVPLDLIATGVDCSLSLGGDDVCGSVNTAGVPVLWTYTPKTGPSGTIPRGGFYEGGINATALVPGFQPCVSSFLVETRSSQSVSAQLKDFALGSFATCGAKISITPSGTNEINATHTFTGHLDVNAGGGFGNAPAGSTINFAKASGPGTLSASSCTTVGSTGSCTVTLSSAVAGVTVVNASATVTVGGATFNPTTNGTGGSSGPATKTWVDANIGVTPLDDTNNITEAHTITATVQQNDGTTTGPAPDGTPVTFTLLNNTAGASFVGGSTCTTTGGSCSVQINTTTAGGVDIHATTTFTVGGVSLTRATGTGGANSADAHKTYVSGMLTWLKHDNQGQLLGGATFQVCRTHDFLGGVMVDVSDVCISVTDNSSPDADPVAGQFKLTGLILGRYTIHETAAPAGYDPDPSTQTVDLTIASPNGSAAQPFVNTPRLVGQIAPTETTCLTYAAGTAGDINQILYNVKSGLINSAAPGVFFYFTRVTAPSASFTVDLVQTVDPSSASAYLFGVHNQELRLFNADCTNSSLGTASFPSAGQASVAISGATAGQVFIISVKYDGGSSVGLPVPTPATLHMDFETKIGATIVDADANGLDLAPKP